jgi:iron(III) transport system permease protein
MVGAPRFAVIRLITLPLVRPAIISSSLLVTILALESFEIPALIGLQGGIYTFTTKIYFVLQQFPIDYPAAGALSLGLLVLALIGVVTNQRLNRGLSKYGTVSGKAFRPRPVPLGKARPFVSAGVLIYFFVAVIAPLLVLIYASLLPFYESPSMDAIRRMSLSNYSSLWHESIALTAFRNSIILGVGSATIVMVLTAVVGWYTVRSKSRFRAAADGLTFAPLVIPGLILGLALVFVYVRVPLAIYGTLLILLIAYVTRFLPYGIRYSSAAMQQVSSELEESARVSGATWFQSFRLVLVPLVSGGLIAGWVYVFLVSFRELSTSILLYTPGREVLAVLIFQEYQNGDLTILSALGVVMIVVLLAVISLAAAAGARIGVREGK